MYQKKDYPRLGEHIDTLMQLTHLTKSIICENGMGGDTYGSFKKARTCT